MKKQIKIIVAVFTALMFSYCSSESQVVENDVKPIPSQNTTASPAEAIPYIATKDYPIKYLALGDSYTIGQSVCESCKFPEQLTLRLKNVNTANNYNLKVIAQTGWTTSNLLLAIENQKPESTFDLVTLLIGVNNQYQNKAFSIYEKEFPELLTKSIGFAKGDKSRVIVLSIPDYAYTPYGQGSGKSSIISAEIDQYNAFAKKYCTDNNIPFITITAITRQGLQNTNLVAQDGLHPSEAAYKLFVDLLAPKAAVIINK